MNPSILSPRGPDWYRGGWSLAIKNQSWTEDTPRQVDFLWKTLNLQPGSRVLDLACGYGRHALELARRGCVVVGVDITPEYIEDARETAAREDLEAVFVHADIRELSFEREFDAVLNMADGAVGYLENDAENLKIFDVISRALRPGGRHFMDVMNAGYADTHFPCSLWEAGEKGLTLSRFEWDRDTRVMLYGQQDIPYGATLERPAFGRGDPIRLYGLDELRGILSVRGMEVENAFADYEGTPASDGGIQLMVASRKHSL